MNRKPLARVLAENPPPFTPHIWQLEDCADAISHDRYALFTPVGGGKTFCGTVVASAWNDPTVLVLVPPVIIPQWVAWLNSLPKIGSAIAFNGAPAQRHALPIENYRWLVMTLDIFKRDAALLTRNYEGTEVTVIVDEAQALKNSGSDNFKKVRDFAEGRKLLMMTGTPMSSPIDAYSYIKLKTPEDYRNLSHFHNMHVSDWNIFKQPTKFCNLDLLSTNLYKQSAHRTKEEIHKLLPKCNYKPLLYELAPAHKKLYDKIAEQMLLELPSGQQIDMTTASALYNGLQQVLVSWSHFAGEPSLRPAAFDVVDETLGEIGWGQAGASKLVIWTYFKRTTEAVLQYVNSLNPGCAVAAYSGSDSAKSVYSFENDPTVTVIVAQPGSAGAGTNFQYVSWESLFLECPTRSIPFRQALGRIDRQGQKYNPTQRFATAKGTLQVKMFRDLLNNDDVVMKVENKRTLRDYILGA